jgi:hypothetical protein
MKSHGFLIVRNATARWRCVRCNGLFSYRNSLPSNSNMADDRACVLLASTLTASWLGHVSRIRWCPFRRKSVSAGYTEHAIASTLAATYT